ncbi:MAG: hypothetical protein JXA87_02850, partial [Thermoleophilia bacterium]|nr:hypothetical protein [Thermoleophilia bacterium]
VLSEVEFRAGRGGFFSTTEVRFPEVEELPGVLSRQLMSPVKFMQSMEHLLAGDGRPGQGVEVGPGAVLTGLLKRIDRGFRVASTENGEALQQVLDAVDTTGGLT